MINKIKAFFERAEYIWSEISGPIYFLLLFVALATAFSLALKHKETIWGIWTSYVASLWRGDPNSVAIAVIVILLALLYRGR